MRILTFTTLFPNSQEKTLGVFIYQRMAHVNRRPGNQVCVVAPVPYYPAWLRVGKRRHLSNVPSVEKFGDLTVYHPRYFLIPKISMLLHGLLIFLGSYRLIRRLHREFQFDCIDAHYVYPDGLAGVMIARRLGLPVVVSARGTDINLFPSFRFIRPMIRWTLGKASGNIAVCRALADEMIALGTPQDHVQVIGNGVDIDRFHPLEEGLCREKLGIPQNARVIVSVGAVIPRKGYRFLISALPIVLKSFPDLHVYIVGKGKQRGELDALAQQLGVQDRVKFVGNQPNEALVHWYSAADVSALLSSREGWPNVVLESLACGTPVVATWFWGVPEILSSPGLGIMVPQEVGAVAGALIQALSTKWNREAIVRYAQSRTWNHVAEEVEDYLMRIVSGPARGNRL